MLNQRSGVAVWTRWSAAAFCCLGLAVGCTQTRDATRALGRIGSGESVLGHREYEAFRAHARQQLMSGEFAELEKTAATLAQRKERFPGGDWKLYRFFQGLAKPEHADDATDATWQHQLKAVENWVKASPQSTAAHIALGQAFVDYAWKARGNGFADTVTEEGWHGFHDRLAEARRVLTEVSSATDKGPHWYSVMQTVALGQAWERDDYESLFAEAVRVEPRYDDFYSAKARYLLPRWSGEDGEWERFADESAMKIGGKEGSALYAHIAWEMSRYFWVNDFFKQNLVSWPRIHQGYLDREALYGETVRHMNELCLLAGGARDKSTMRAVLPRVAGRWDEDVWKEKKYFDGFREWAGN